MTNKLLPVRDDVRRRQFFTVPHDDESVLLNTSLQRTTLNRTVITKKTTRDMSVCSNNFDPLTTASLWIDNLSFTRKNSPEVDVQYSTLPACFSVYASSRINGASSTFRRDTSDASASHTCGRPGTFHRHEYVSAHVKTLQLSELGPGRHDNTPRHETISSSSVLWNVKRQCTEGEASYDSNKIKAGRQLTTSSHKKCSRLHKESNARLKRDRQTKSAGRPKSQSNLCTAAVLLCFAISLSFWLLCTSNTRSYIYNHELNITTLDANLQRKVFGQHIALDVISKALSTYLSDDIPRHPLVFSFHGWTGVGKNHVVNIISEELDILAVHKIIMPLHSLGYDSSQRLTEWVSSNNANMSTVLFVIDELGKASPDFLQGLYDLLSHWQEKIYTSSHVILILLSNTGGTAVNQYSSQCMNEGRSRESIAYNAVVTAMLRATSRNTWLHRFVSRGLIDHVVPFLPLERSHVVQCIEAYLRDRHMVAKASMIDQVLSQLRFFPDDWPVFSLTGCRQVAGKVDLIAG